jgi:uncharacterized SAM-binding protein YcdF (DUF218 family)
MEKLSLLLWRERELLDELLFRLEIEQVVLAGGRTRWLARAAGDVQDLLEELRRSGVLRAALADEAAAGVGLPDNPSLRALAEASPEPWRAILMEHRDAFVAVTAEISALAGSNRDLITSGYHSAREVLTQLGGTDTYTPDGAPVPATAGPRLVDRSL